jgi:alkylation response protein AidB-like acyl-CoA dehydrogenase
MEFCLSEEQVMLSDTVKRFLDDASPLDRVRELAADGAVHDAAIWQGLAELGLTGMLVPEEYGGMAMTLLDAMLVQEALGAHVTPVSFAPTSVLAVLALSRGGSDEQKQRWLPAIAEGSLQVAVAISEATGAREGAGVTAVGGRLNGRSMFVLGDPQALLVLVADGQGDLYAVEREARGVAQSVLRSIDDTQPFFELNFDGAPAERLPGCDAELVPALVDAGRVMLAADTLGAAQEMLDRAVAYAGERKQFNRVIGSFQAVKHLCAEMAAELEPSRSLVWYAAHACDAVPAESRLMACHAKAHLAEIGRFIARTATEVHGGMGFTDLMGLHYWFKRIGFNRQVLGSPERVREEAARVQGWV